MSNDTSAARAESLLSKQDIERLLTENTPQVRIDVVNRITDAHLNRRYSLQDFAIAEQVMRILVNDTQISVREALAMRLKDNPYIPSDIIIALSNNVDSVALPVIENSPLLTDSDLISLINSCKNTSKQCAVAGRKSVSAEVSAALVATRNAQVVSRLAKNPDAAILPETYHAIIQDHAGDKDIMKSVSERPNLPATIMEKVIHLVSESVSSNLRSKFDVAPAIIEGESEKNREVATLMLVDGGVDKQEIEKLVEQLLGYGRLTPSIILTSLCRGNLYFFETSLAHLSNIPVQNAQLLIHDKGGLGFKALYNKAGLPDKFFEACKLLLQVVATMRRKQENLSGTAYSNAVIHNLLEQSSGKKVDNLSYIIALIRQSV